MPEPEQGIEPGDDAMRLNDRRARTRAGAALGQLSHPDLARRHQRTSLLSPRALRGYRSRLMMKLGVRDVASLVKFALEHGLMPPQ